METNFISHKLKRQLFAFLMSLSGLYSCKEMDATYEEYIQDGEIVYVARVDSLQAYPGDHRVLLTWRLGTDPKVSKVQIYWNNREMMKELPISENIAGQRQEIMLEDLEEGSYFFEVITYDEAGHSSVTATVNTSVFGEDYMASLLTRRIKQAQAVGGNVYIDWYGAHPDAIMTEIVYTNTDREQAIVRSRADVASSVLPGYDSNSEIRYRTLFMPDSTAVDTFYSEYNQIKPEFLLDKAKFKRWNTPDFPYTEYNAGQGYNIEKLWDEVYTGYGYIYLETQPLPRSFTFDLGQTAVVDKIRLSPNWQSQLYKNGNIKKAEIWGSATPEVSTDFSTWTYLGSLESIKPSGLPLGQATDEDLAYAKAGENFELADDLPPVRYIRFVVQDTWSGSISMHISELTFWGKTVTAD